MSKYLIFFRHGMAEDKSKAENDDLRSLSIRGKRLIERSISGFKVMLGKHNNIQIYSSPKLRARQTAKILCDGLRLGEPIYLDYLATGGHVGHIRQLVTDMEPGTVAILVGQQAYLSIWGQELSGIFLPFKKGATACFKFPNEGGEVKAELRWYLQTRDFIKIRGK